MSAPGSIAALLLSGIEDTETFIQLARFWERNTQVIYPSLVGFALASLLVGIIQAWRSEDLRGLDKVELKREVLIALRRHPHGANGEMLARDTGIQAHHLVKLLEDMQRQGWVSSFTNTERLTIWRANREGR